MTRTMFVHGQEVHKSNCKAIRTCDDYLAKIDSLNIRTGHPEIHFSEISKARKGQFKSSSGNLVAFVDNILLTNT